MNYDPKDPKNESNEWRSDEAPRSGEPETENTEPVNEPVNEPAEQPAENNIIDAEIVPEEPQTPQTPYGDSQPPCGCQPAAPRPDDGRPPHKKSSTKAFVGVLVILACVVLIGTAITIAFTLGGNHGNGGTTSSGSNPGGTVSAPGITIDELITMENADNLAPKAAYQKILPSVVSIKCYESMNSASYGEGTGIVISADGYILTNEHVVADAAMVMVTTNDGQVYQAEVIAKDTETDIAVIKIQATGLTVAEFASSDQTEVGQFVMAVGNPTGSELQNSATFGILSGKSRVPSADAYTTMLQVDAAVNPGNSGGPLINLAGQVIGVVSSKIADVDYEGIGFAIPSDQALEVVRNLLEYGYVKGRVRVGITVIELTPAEVLKNNLPGNVAVVEVNSDSDAAKKGLKQDDIITAINGETVTSSAQLISTIRSFKPGDKVSLSVYRRTGGVTENLTLEIELYEYVSK